VAGTVSSLLMVAQHAKKTAEDKAWLDFAWSWAKLNHGCTGSACVVEFTSYADFVAKLKSYTKIGTLSILAHSAGNTLTFYDPAYPTAQELKSLDDIRASLGAAAPEVEKVRFLGCEVGHDPEAMWNLAVTLRSKSIVGHNYFHAFQVYHVTVGTGATVGDITSQLPTQEAFLIPSTDLSQVAAHPGKTQIFAEWFTKDYSRTPLDQVSSLELGHVYMRRAQAQKKTVDSLVKAQALKQSMSTDFAQDFMEIEVVR
jgi:hypothetical protein